MTTPKVLLKRSSVVGRVPQPGDLDYGELAINFVDGKIYYKNSSNQIVAFIDSARTQSLIDAVNQAAEDQLDSAEVIALVDSAYIQLRQSYDATLLNGDSAGFYREYPNLRNKPVILDIIDIQNIIDDYVDVNFIDNLNTDADTLDGLNSTQFLRSDSDTTLTADLTIDSNLTVGGDATFNNDVTLSGNLYGPATMYIDPAAHDSDTGRVIIRGDLQVDGTQTIVNSTSVSINDKNIVLADSATNAAEADGAGITVNGANANITYNAAEDEWQFNKKAQAPNLEVTNVIDATTVNTTNITATTINTTNITGNYTNFDSDFDSALGTKTTTDVAEGTNLYYTKTRVDSDFDQSFAEASTDSLGEGSNNLYYTTTRADSDFDVRITTKTTNNLTEGDNLYYTTVRADSDARSALSARKISGFGDLTYDSAAGKFSYTGISTQEVRDQFAAQGDLSYDSSTGVFSIDVETVYTKTDFDSDLGDASTDDLPEGDNLYYTTVRHDSDFDVRFATKTTDDLTEGSTNLYYTKARADSDIAASLNDSGNTVNITINNTIEDKVDSAYVLARVTEAPFLDSGDALQLIDSAHVQLKAKGLDYNVLSNTPALIDSTLVTQLIDSAYIGTVYDQSLNTTDDVTFNSVTSDLNGAIEFTAKNDEGSTLTKGTVVYINGISGNKATVAKADASDPAKMPAFGIVAEDANDNANTIVFTFGTLYNLDTSAFNAGDTLYVSTTAGELTNVKPAGESNLLQNIGRVIRSHASAGSIKVGGAGRTNAVPNLNNDQFFLGNDSNYAVVTDFTAAVTNVVDSAYIKLNTDSAFVENIINNSTTVFENNVDSAYVQLHAKGLDYNVLSNKPALIDSTLVTQLIDSTYIRVTIDSAHIENVINNSTTVFVNNVDSSYVQLKAKGLDYDVLSNKPNVLDSSDIVGIIVSETLDSDLIINLVDSAYIQLRDRFQDSAGVKAVIDSAYVRARVKTDQDLRTTDSVSFAGITVSANSITWGESDATMTYLPDSDMIEFNKAVKGEQVQFTGATIQSDSGTFNGLYVYDNRRGQKDWVARFSRRQDEYSSPATVLITTDAEARSDIALEVRGNANSTLLGPEFDDKFHDDSNTTFAVYGSGHTLIGYSNLPGGVGALYPYSMLSGDNDVKLQVNYGISVDSNLVFHEGNYTTYIDSAYIEARRPAETVFSLSGNGSDYVFSGDGFPSTANDPTLYLTRGKTYKFTNVPGSHPLEIRLSNGGTAYSDGVTNNGGSGTVEFTVPMNAPTSLVYQCTVHGGMVGDIVINAAAGLDSAQIINLIDSAYVQLRDSSDGGGGGGGVDSATTIALIDSAYIKARVDHNTDETLIFGDDQFIAGALSGTNTGTQVVTFFNSIYPVGQFIASYDYANGGLPLGQWLYGEYWVNSSLGYFKVINKVDLNDGTYRYYCVNTAGNAAPSWAGGWTQRVFIAQIAGERQKPLEISHQANGDYILFEGHRNYHFFQNDSSGRDFKIELANDSSVVNLIGGGRIHYANSYDSDGDFPDGTIYKGMTAHAKNNDAMYYANDSGVWTTIAGTGAQAFQDSAVVVGLIDSDYILGKKFVPGDAERRWNITSAAPAGAQAVAVGDYWLDRDTEVLYKLTADTNWTTTLPAGTFTAEAGLTSNNWFANGVGGDPASFNQGPLGPVGTFNRTFLMGTSPYNSGGRYTFTQPVNFGYFQIGNLASGHIYSVGYTDGSYMVSNTGINGSKTATPSSYTWYDANGVSLGQTVAAGSGFRNYSHPNGTLATYIIIGRNNYGTRGYSCYMFFSGASSWERIGEIYDDSDIKNVIDSAYITGIAGSGGGSGSVDSAAIINLIDSAYVQARQTAGGGGTDSAAVQTLIDAALDSGAVPFTQKYFHFTSDSGHKIYSGFDDDSDTLAYTAGALTVFLNGILLLDSVDYTATSGTSIVLTDSAALGDILTVQTFAGNSFGLDSAQTINLIDSAYIAARTTAGTDSAAIINLIDSAYVNARVSFTGPSSSRTALGLTAVTTGVNNATWTFDTDASAENFKLLIDGVYLASSATGAVLGFKDAGGKYFSVGDNYNSHNFTRSVVAVRTNNAVTLTWYNGLAYSWANFTDYSGGFSAAFTANGGTLPLVSVYSPRITNGQPGSFTTPYVVGDATTGNAVGAYGTNTTNFGALTTVAASATYLSLTSAIDSDYVAERVNALDSAEAINLIDSAYVRARQNFAYSALTSTPTDLSDFNNDVGYITDASFDDFESREFIGNQGGLTDKVYSFIVPTGVTTISAVAIAGGGGGGDAASGTDGVGGGGGLSYDTSLAVTPGETLTITVGHSGNGGLAPSDPPNSIGTGSPANNTTIKRGSTVLLQANGGTGGSGGTNGTGGSGGTTLSYDGGGNGGVRGAGQYTGNGGSSGSASLLGTSSTDYLYGEGGAGELHGQKGAVRIIWGAGRSYPNTNIVQTFNNVYGSGTDSATVISLIDSAYINARVDPFDSSHVLNLVDSAYIQLRDRFQDSSGILAIVDSAYVQARQSEATNIDSIGAIGNVNAIGAAEGQILKFDSATQKFILETDGGGGGLDSALVSQLIDSDYIGTKVDFTRGEFTTQRSQYTATAAQTVFNHSSIDATHLDVYLNGVLQVVNDDYTATTSAVTFSTGVDSGYSVSIIERRGRVATQRGLVESKYYFTTPTPITSITGADDNGITLDYSIGGLDVYLNGILLKDSDDYTTNAGSAVTLISATDSNDLVTLVNRKGIVVTPNVKNYEFTASAGQTTFTGSDINSNTLAYVPGALQVHLNGILLRNADFTATTGSSITLVDSASLNDELVVSAFSNPGQNMDLYKFTADSGQTIFSGNDIVGASLAYQPGNIQVFMNGLLLNDSDDYNALNGMSVVLTSGADASDEIKIASFVTNSDTIRTNAWSAPSGTPVAAVAGDKLFIDTSTAKTVTLPSSASLGDEIRIIDVTGNASSNNITVARNGHKIQGAASDLTINVDRAGIGLVYYNAAQGWVLIEN